MGFFDFQSLNSRLSNLKTLERELPTEGHVFSRLLGSLIHIADMHIAQGFQESCIEDRLKRGACVFLDS